MNRFRFPFFTILLCTPSFVLADDPAVERARAELKPRLVTLIGEAMPFDQAMKTLQEKTGNTIDDLRTHPENPKLKLALKDVTFWEAIDEISRQAKCGYSLYQKEGTLTLVDTPQRRLNTTYSGICRLAVKRVSVTHDDENGTSYCNVLLELAWEPRFQPFFLDVGPVVAMPEMMNGLALDASALSKVPVAQRNATEVELRFPAPQRICPRLLKLSGKFTLLGPSKMLTFRFDNLKQGQKAEQTKEEVSVGLEPKSLAKKFWSFDVAITNPPGGPSFESFQARAWLENNRIFLQRDRAGKIDKISHVANKQKENKETKATGAWLHYVFENNDLSADTKDWSVVYRTPGRIVELTLPFTLKDIPLP